MKTTDVMHPSWRTPANTAAIGPLRHARFIETTAHLRAGGRLALSSIGIAKMSVVSNPLVSHHVPRVIVTELIRVSRGRQCLFYTSPRLTELLQRRPRTAWSTT